MIAKYILLPSWILELRDKKSQNTRYWFQCTKCCGFVSAKPYIVERQDKKCTIKKKICLGHRKNLWVFITADLLKFGVTSLIEFTFMLDIVTAQSLRLF